jgi:nucleoside-diphosphate-sugar epimerase
LCQHLAQARAGRVVLISTVDVYPSPVEVDEDAAIDPAAAEPYGRHRLELEQFVRERFECTVVRLPGLFGHGLKKNVIFDFLNDNQVDRIHPGGVFQFYDVDHLARDLRTALLHRLELLNISAEPVGVDEVARICLGRELCGAGLGPAPRYDYRSRHARLFGGRDGYTYSRAQVLADLRRYVAEVRVMQA